MFILWYSASSTFGKDSDIVMGVRAQQKEKTRRSLVEAAFSQLSAERSFASLSLREVAREAGIAPTSFYRHFRDVDELGLRAAVAREIQHFIAELADYLELENHMPRAFTEAQAEAMVTIVFSAGAEALDVGVEQRRQLEERLVLQLRMISKGAYYWYRREQEKTAIIPGNVKDE